MTTSIWMYAYDGERRYAEGEHPNWSYGTWHGGHFHAYARGGRMHGLLLKLGQRTFEVPVFIVGEPETVETRHEYQSLCGDAVVTSEQFPINSRESKLIHGAVDCPACLEVLAGTPIERRVGVKPS